MRFQNHGPRPLVRTWQACVRSRPGPLTPASWPSLFWCTPISWRRLTNLLHCNKTPADQSWIFHSSRSETPCSDVTIPRKQVGEPSMSMHDRWRNFDTAFPVATEVSLRQAQKNASPTPNPHAHERAIETPRPVCVLRRAEKSSMHIYSVKDIQNHFCPCSRRVVTARPDIACLASMRWLEVID